LREFKTIISEYNCDTILVSGTNAFRIATNSTEIIESIRSEFGLNLKIISGVEEAEYAYLGALSAVKERTTVSVIDIGGSSTEIITVKESNILAKVSLQIGSVTATEQYLKTSPPNRSDLENLKGEICGQFSTFDKNSVARRVVAIAGTATTLACMKLGLKEFDENLVDNFTINIIDLKDLVSQISRLSTTEILKNYGAIMEGREDIILAGAIILEQFMMFYEINSVKVSTRGIRYGAIVKHLIKDTMDSDFV
jgi:exopolyphosphatase/guanosine-5'-triphosphate,3'-diphosphate pyrophosphatase